MDKEDNIDAIKFYVKQKQIDEMREYTKDYGRDQFVRTLVNQRTEIAYLKQTIKEIEKHINDSGQGKFKVVFGENILQIIDKYKKEDD